MTRAGAALATALALGALPLAALHAQADSAARDSAAAPDTMPAWLAVAPAALPPGPLAPGQRLVFPADSLVFSDIRTLADLLAHVPGAFVARGGFYGQAEPVLFGGRGAAGLTVFWDGVPVRPLGRDSVFLDPARIPLASVERVEVIRHPAALEVHLVSRRHRSTPAETVVGIVTGSGNTNVFRYLGSFARRWRSGVGLALLVDHNNHDDAGGSTTAFSNTDLWLKAEWMPSGLFGAQYQIVSTNWKRNNAAAGLVDAWKQQRLDRLFRVFAAQRDDGLGWRTELSWASAVVTRDTAVPGARLRQGGATVSYRWPTAHVALTARAASRPPWPLELAARAAWAPLPPLVVSAEAGRAEYPGGEAGADARIGAGLTLPLGLSARGELAWTRARQAPALGADTVQTTTDAAGAVRWDHRLATVELAGGRRDPFVPLGAPAGLAPLGGLGPTPASEYVALLATVRPTAWLELTGWYADAYAGRGDFEPPHHARVSATFQSKFWRTFPSGIFALRGELAMESWSRGPGGRDTTAAAAPLVLGGATFVESNVQLRVGDVTVHWVMRNLYGMRGGYVPGLGYPQAVQYFGVTWTFNN